MRKIRIVVLIAICIFFISTTTTVGANELNKFYTYYKHETRVINDNEYIETEIYGYRNLELLGEASDFTLPKHAYSNIAAAKVIGIWVNEEKLDSKYYIYSKEDNVVTVEFDIEDEVKTNELSQKFKEMGDFEIIIIVYIKTEEENNRNFYEKEGKHIFFTGYHSAYDKNDIYNEYILTLPYPSEHNLKMTALLEMKSKRVAPTYTEIKNGDLRLSWFITFQDKKDQFEIIKEGKAYCIWEVSEGKNEEELTFTIYAEYSYESLPLLQLLCVLIISFPIGFTAQFFRDVKDGEYKKIEKLKTRKYRVKRKIDLFLIRNFEMKIRYTIFSFVVLAAIILVLFAPDVFNTEAIRLFYIKLSSLHLFSIESAKFVQNISIFIITIFVLLGIYLVADFQTRQKYMSKIDGKLQNILRFFSPTIFTLIVMIIVLLFAYANGQFQSDFIANIFIIEMGLEIYIFLGLVAYLKLYWVSIR